VLIPAELIRHAAAALRRALPAGVPPLLLSRFGIEFLGPIALRAAPIEIALSGGCGRLLARRIAFPDGDFLATSVEPARPDSLPAALVDALPVLIGGACGASAAVQLQAAQALGPGPAPALARIRDWIRIGCDDPLRWIDPELAGPRFVELRGDAAPGSSARHLLDRLGVRDEVVALARRGPSGATEADLVAARRLGADVIVEGDAAELVVARHQGIPLLSVALLLDCTDEAPGSPGELARRAEALLPGAAALLAALAASREPRAESHAP
jgi:hypothetical protein